MKEILKNKNKHPRDNRIKQHEDFIDNHIYLIDDESKHGYISGTSFINKFFTGFDAKKIIDTYYQRWQDTQHPKYYGLTREEIKDTWKQNGKDASQLGTELHEHIELYYNDEKVSNIALEWAYFLSFVDDFPELEPYRTEWMVFDDENKICGTIDKVFKRDDKYVIYDWKRKPQEKYEKKNIHTAKYPISHIPEMSYWQDCLQLNLYSYILETKYGLEIEEMNLLLLHPDNSSYIRYKVPNLREEIINILNERRHFGVQDEEYPVKIRAKRKQTLDVDMWWEDDDRRSRDGNENWKEYRRHQWKDK